MAHLQFKFEPRWKEELVGSCSEGTFVLEMTMGELNVFLPTETVWQEKAPSWAKSHWHTVRAQLEQWCSQQKIPLIVEDHAWVA